MSKRFAPTIYVKNVFNINFEQLKSQGIKMICFDLDNTLDKPDQHTKNKTPRMHEFIEGLKKEFDVMIVSNNTIENRVSSFANLYNLEYIEGMRKPFKKNYKHQKILKYKKHEVIFVGDKLVTDVLGANRLGYKSILVDPLYPKDNKWYSKVMSTSDNIFSKITLVKRSSYYNMLEDNE